MIRRRFMLLGAGAMAAAASAPYAPLLAGDLFEDFVASKLGIDTELATRLLARAREHYGEPEYGARAASFAIAFREPLGGLIPARLRRAAAEAMLDPMFSTPVAALAYAEGIRDPALPTCPGLIRSA